MEEKRGATMIVIYKSDEQIMFENFNTEERLEEVIEWITNDFWHELSNQSKTRVIKQLRYMGYTVEDLKIEEAQQ